MSDAAQEGSRRSSRPQRKRVFLDTYEHLGRDEEKQINAALKASLEPNSTLADESDSEDEEITVKPGARRRGRPRSVNKKPKPTPPTSKHSPEPHKSEQNSPKDSSDQNPKTKRKKVIIRQKQGSGDPVLPVRPQRKFAAVTANGKKPPVKRKATPKKAPTIPPPDASDDTPQTEEFIDYLCLRKSVPNKSEWKQFSASGDEDSLVIAESEDSSTGEAPEDFSIFDFDDNSPEDTGNSAPILGTKHPITSSTKSKKINGAKKRRITQNYYNAKLRSTDNTENSAQDSAPIFRPTGEEFKNFHAYLEKITPQLLAAGMCKVIPPFKWKVNQVIQEDIRFSTKSQEVHRLCHRSGPSSIVLSQIKAHLIYDHGFEWKGCPQIGTVIVDLTRFSWLMKKNGGLQVVIDKNKWSKLGDALGIPQVAERNEQLEDVYCKYLLSYDLLTDEQKLNLKTDELNDNDDVEHQGKQMTLSALRRHDTHARKIKFSPDGVASATSLELEFWNLLCSAEEHQAAPKGVESTITHGSGFPAYEPRHIAGSDWNLTNLRHLPDGVMGFLPDVPFITQPRLEFCSLFSASGWHVEPHFLPLISYNHFSHPRIWYASPASDCQKFLSTMHDLAPRLIPGNHILDPNSIMVPPAEFSSQDIKVCRAVQKPGEFIITAPKSYISHFSLGLNVNETVNFATEEWLHYCSESLSLYQSWKLKPPLNVPQIIIDVIKRHDSLNESSLRAAEPFLTSLLTEELESRAKCKLAVASIVQDAGAMYCEECLTICHLSLIRPGDKIVGKMKEKRVRNKKSSPVFCLKHGCHVKVGVLECRISDPAINRLLSTLNKRLYPIRSIVHPVQSLARSVCRPQMTPSPVTLPTKKTADTSKLAKTPDKLPTKSDRESPLICPASPEEQTAKETHKGLNLIIPSKPLVQCTLPPSPVYATSPIFTATKTPSTPTLAKPIPIKPMKSPIIPSLAVRPQPNYFSLVQPAVSQQQQPLPQLQAPALWERWHPGMSGM